MECTVGASLLEAAITAVRTLRAQQKAIPVIGQLSPCFAVRSTRE
jgi:hypothetical protein